MMTASDALNQTWGAVLAEASQAEGFYHRRISLDCSWPAHAGIQRPADSRFLIFEAESKALRGLRLQDETKGYRISVGPDEAGRDDRVSILIQETSQIYREIFTIFCADILEHWCPHVGAGDALKSLSGRLARWKKFFQRGAPAGLNREDYIGLYGELSLVEAGLNAGVTPLGMINAWQGPLGTNQDFLFGPLAVEIKSTTGNDINNVRISNARQLDSTGIKVLFLSRYAFDFRQGGGRTLPQLVAALKGALFTTSPEALAVFNDRLLDAGFAESIPNELDSWGFSLRRLDIFRVGDGFPRVLESSLPSGLSEVAYTLNLAAAISFQVAETDLWPTVCGSNA